MLVAEFIRINAKLLKTLSDYGIKMDDYKYVDLFRDFVEMRTNGDKTTYIVVKLAEKYKLSETSVYRVLRRLRITI